MFKTGVLPGIPCEIGFGTGFYTGFCCFWWNILRKFGIMWNGIIRIVYQWSGLGHTSVVIWKFKIRREPCNITDIFKQVKSWIQIGFWKGTGLIRRTKAWSIGIRKFIRFTERIMRNRMRLQKRINIFRRSITNIKITFTTVWVCRNGNQH